jgi:hypothetical protein
MRRTSKGGKAMTETDQAEGLRAVSRALDSLRGSPLQRNGEPQFRKIGDPPGKTLIGHYLHQESRTTSRRLIFYAEVPAPGERNERSAWFIRALLEQWGDPDWNKRELMDVKEARLTYDLEEERVELIIVADIHHLVLEHRILIQRMDWLLSLFQRGVKAPLVIVGETQKLNQLIASDGRFGWRFLPIHLPGETHALDPATNAVPALFRVVR